MATRKQFHKLILEDCDTIPRGGSTIGGTVIGDYIAKIDGMPARVLVVEMPKVEKKAGAKKAKKAATKSSRLIEAPDNTEMDAYPPEVTHGA